MSPTSRGPECLDDATLLAFLDGGLSGEARARVDAHVDGCAACLRLVAALGRSESQETPQGPERYEIRRELGAGGMGLVFEAFDTVLGRDVALKCVRPGREGEAAARRFEREMSLTARLQHPSIIPVYDAGFFPDGSHYFAMRLVEGQTLDAAIAQTSSFEDRMALVPSIRRVCEAVAFAHEQLVIHRDLKPANVLIGPFGETVVLDWGLAKHLDDNEHEAESLHGDADVEGMTRPGAVMGTRGYIAPEVERGESADQRSDVFGLGKVLAQLVSAEALTDARREVRTDLQAIIELATAPEPALRYPSARELCEDLRRFEAGQRVLARDYSLRSRMSRFVRRHRTPIGLSGAFVTVGVLVGVGVASVGGLDGRQPCTGAEEALVGVWDETTRSRGRESFASIGKPYAVKAWSRAEQVLDAYAAAWTESYTAACEGHARGEVSGELLDLRMDCLDRAAMNLGATTEVLVDADSTIVGKAEELTAGLPPIARCEDPDVLLGSVQPPSTSEEAKVEEARGHIGRAEALRKGVRLDDARKALDAARAALVGISYEPVRTELAVVEGWLMTDLGDYEAADAVLSEALRLGMAFHQRDETHRALLRMVFLLRERGKVEEALRHMPVLEGLSEGDPAAQAAFHSSLANTLKRKGDHQRAEIEHRAALEIRERMPEANPVSIAISRKGIASSLEARGKVDEAVAEVRAALEVFSGAKGLDHPGSASIRGDLAVMLDGQGKYAEAEAEARASLRVLEDALPSGHPDITVVRITLGNALFAQGKLSEAETEYRRALAASAAREEMGSPSLPAVRNNLANILFIQKRFEEAEQEYRGALEMAKAVIGPEHPSIALYRNSLANALASTQQYAEAEAEYRAALELQLGALPSGSPEIGTTRTNLGNSLLGQGRFIEAESEFRQALELFEAAFEDTHPLVAKVRSNLGQVLLELDRPQQARALLEKAWTVRKEEEQATKAERGTTAFLLARALWRVGEKQRAREMGLQAREAFANDGELSEGELKEVETWLTR